ncbi:MAG: hypothetical protein VR69_11765 [Peptococcaceae bacterium BRH_c4b]|nr:MAG: hypothetical protein VR69_11765 [Peptococcaceae bacterium BRH_c4b]
MLVLTRKKGQSINIGNDIRVVLLDVTGDTVRIGLDAPSDVAIYRSEIFQTLRRENREAVANLNAISEIENLVKISHKDRKS